MAESQQSLSTARYILITGIAASLGGAIALAHGTNRAHIAHEAAGHQTHEVHIATRVFLDWLAPEAVDIQLDAMTLRRVHLLEHARARRIQGLGILAALIGAMTLILAYTSSVITRGITRLPDKTVNLDTLRPTNKKGKTQRPRGYRAPSQRHLQPNYAARHG